MNYRTHSALTFEKTLLIKRASYYRVSLVPCAYFITIQNRSPTFPSSKSKFSIASYCNKSVMTSPFCNFARRSLYYERTDGPKVSAIP